MGVKSSGKPGRQDFQDDVPEDGELHRENCLQKGPFECPVEYQLEYVDSE